MSNFKMQSKDMNLEDHLDKDNPGINNQML